MRELTRWACLVLFLAACAALGRTVVALAAMANLRGW